MRRIGIVTVGRSDFGLYRPLLTRLRACREVRLKLFVAGAHLARAHGRTVTEVEASGFRDYTPVRMLTGADDEVAVGVAAGKGTTGFARAFAAWRPDILVVLGDRYEMHAAVVAAVVLNIPVAHLHGGEISEGAIDDALRHSMTKLSHLHFASTSDYARRIRQMGEEPWRVHHVGAIGLDNLREVQIMSPAELGASLGWEIPPQFVLFTYHPVTLGGHDSASECRAVLAALEQLGLPVLFTAPNADAGGRALDLLVRRYVARRRESHYVNNLGLVRYYSAMTHATLMAGNSSSGIIEAASFNLPVVNIGERQRGRIHRRNVIDCAPRRNAILPALRQAVRMRADGTAFENPYYAGGAAERIVQVLLRAPLDGRLLRKRFIDTH